MYTPDGLYMGLSEEGQRVYMKLNMCNRHGIITGASGTGKTITMKVMAESFADAGVRIPLRYKGRCLGSVHAGDPE